MKAEGSLNLQVPVGAGVAVPTKSSVRPAILENRGPRQRDSQGPSTTAQLQAAAGGAGADRERLDRQGDGDDPTGAANLGPSGSPGRSTGGGGPSAAQLEEELSKGGKQKLSPEEEDRRKERTRAEVDIVPLVDASAMASLRHAFNAGGGRLGCPSFVRAMLESLDLGIDKEQLREYSLERQKQHQRDIFSDLPAFPKPALAALQDEGAEGQEETGERGRGPKGPRFEGDGPDGEGAGAPLNDNAGAFLTQMDTANENPPSIPPSPAPPPISLEAPTSVVALAAFDTNVKGKPSPAGALSVPNPSTGDPLVSPLGSPVIPDASSRGRKGISEGLVSAAGGGREGRPHIPPGSYWLTEEGLGKVATATVEMFEWADCDCDGRLGWEEFSDYLIDAGMAGRQDDVVDKMKRYEQSRVDDLTHHESTIDNAVFLEALDSVAVFHSGAKTFKLYDPHTCTIKKDVSGHRGSAITACHVGSYGQVATSAADMSVCLWSADTMTLRQRIACQDVQMCLQWMGEGGAAGRELLATGATNGIVTLWDLLTLTERKELLQSQENNPPSVNALLLLPDMEVLASALDAGERGGVVQLWDAATCRLAGELGGAKGHQKAVGSLAYSRQFNCLLSAGMDQDAIAWNPYVQRDPIFKLKGHAHALVGVVTVPGTVQIITGDVAGSLKLWDMRNFRAVHSFGGTETLHELNAFCVAHTIKRVFGASFNSLCLYDYADTHEETLRVTEPHGCTGALFAEAPLRFLSLSQQHAKAWDASNGKLLQVHRNFHTAEITCACVDSTGKKVYVGDSEGNVCSRSLKTGAFIREFVPHAVDVSAVKIWEGTDCIISASWDGIVKVHQDDPLSDDPRGTVRMEAPTSSDGVGCLAVAPALQLLAAAAGRAVYLFCLRTNRKDKVIDKFLLPKDGVLGGSRGETGAAILSVDFLDEKGILVAGDQSGIISLWYTRPHPPELEGQCIFSWENLARFDELFLKNSPQERWGRGQPQGSAYEFKYKRRERLPEDDVRLTLSPTAVTSVCFVKPKDLTRPPGFMWQQRALQRWRLGYQQPGLGGAMGASTEGAEAELATPMFTIFSAEGVEGDEIDWDSGEEVKTVIPEEGGEKEESSGEEGGQTQAEGEDKGEKASGEAEKEKEGQSDDAKGERGDGQRGVVGATGSLTAPLESPFQVGFLLTGDSSGFIRAWDLSVFFQHYGLEDPFPGGTHVFGEGGGGIDFEEMAWGETGAEGTGEEGNGPTPLGKYRGDSSGQGEGDGMEGAGETKSPDVSPFGRTGTSKIAAGLTMAATSMSLGETALKGSQHKEKQQNKYLRESAVSLKGDCRAHSEALTLVEIHRMDTTGAAIVLSSSLDKKVKVWGRRLEAHGTFLRDRENPSSSGSHAGSTAQERRAPPPWGLPVDPQRRLLERGAFASALLKRSGLNRDVIVAAQRERHIYAEREAERQGGSALALGGRKRLGQDDLDELEVGREQRQREENEHFLKLLQDGGQKDEFPDEEPRRSRPGTQQQMHKTRPRPFPPLRETPEEERQAAMEDAEYEMETASGQIEPYRSPIGDSQGDGTFQSHMRKTRGHDGTAGRNFKSKTGGGTASGRQTRQTGMGSSRGTGGAISRLSAVEAEEGLNRLVPSPAFKQRAFPLSSEEADAAHRLAAVMGELGMDSGGVFSSMATAVDPRSHRGTRKYDGGLD